VVNLRWAALLALPVGAGLLAGYAAGGSLAGLVATRLRVLWLLWLAAGVQTAQLASGRLAGSGGLPGAAARDLRGPLLVAVFALAGAWLAANLAGRPRAMQAAAGLALAGGLANGVAIAANGRMPYLPGAARAAGLARDAETPKNVVAGPASHLAALGDIIPVPPLHAVISLGDVLIVAGVIVLIAAAMRQVPSRRRSGGAGPLRKEVTE
jgi:Family of unknown function (DUF5317)